MKKNIYLSLLLLFLFKMSISAQKQDFEQINAQIVDEDYKPIAFATIYSKMKERGTISRKDGKFSIMVARADTLELSAISYEKRKILVDEILRGDTVIIMKKKVYMIDNVNVMALRWHDFKHKMMNSKAKDENKEVVQIEGLPNVYRPRVELSEYAGMTNPVSILLTYMSRKNRYKRKKERWNRIYNKSLKSKPDTLLLLKKIK